MKTLFISKSSQEVKDLDQLLKEQGIVLIAHSFLEFERVYTTIPRAYDVIFFSSPRSAVFYLGQHPLPVSIPVACAGEKTAKVVREMGRRVDFTGEGPISEVATDFFEWCGDRHVLFPVSNRSLKTISSRFPEDQKTELTVYRTIIAGKEISPCDGYVFTSPSNAEGFLMNNVLPEGVAVIAWGESTASYLKSQGIQPTRTLRKPSIEGLLEVIL